MNSKNSALGLIETYGFVGAIEAMDTALKTADVKIIKCEFIKGGIVTVILTGDVSSVKAAVDASKTAAIKLGNLLNAHVITRTSEDVLINMISNKTECLKENKSIKENNHTDMSKEDISKEERIEKIEKVEKTENLKQLEILETVTENVDNASNISISNISISNINLINEVKTLSYIENLQKLDNKELIALEEIDRLKLEEIEKLRAEEVLIRENLETLKVMDLRVIARKTKGIQMSKREIRDSKKDDLINNIVEAKLRRRNN